MYYKVERWLIETLITYLAPRQAWVDRERAS